MKNQRKRNCRTLKLVGLRLLPLRCRVSILRQLPEELRPTHLVVLLPLLLLLRQLTRLPRPLRLQPPHPWKPVVLLPPRLLLHLTHLPQLPLLLNKPADFVVEPNTLKLFRT
jgi:hypothetical protein